MAEKRSTPADIPGWRQNLGPLLTEIRYGWHLLTLNKLVLTGTFIAVGMTLIAVVGPFFVPTGTNVNLNVASGQEAILGNSQLSLAHPLGVDSLGRDMLGMVVLALSLDLGSAVVIVASALVIGIVLGGVAGFIGGKLDELIMRVTDIFLAFPALILALGVAAALGRSLINLVLALMIVRWPISVRLIRGQVLIEREKPYVEALKALGVGRWRTILRHIIPNSIFPVLVQASLDIGNVILTFAALSFLGFAVDYFTPELGRMVLDGQNFIQSNPLLITYPVLVIFITALAFNLLGDGLLYILYPRLRR